MILKWLKSLYEKKVADIVKSRRELLQVFDGLSDPVAVIDKQFLLQRVNRAVLGALGKKSYQEFIGKPCYEMLHGLKQICPQCTAAETFKTGEKTTRSGFIEAKAKPFETTYNVACYPLTNDKGEVTAIAEYYQDVTELIHLTRELYESERARVMEPLAAGLSHQIRQPLTIIRSAAQYVTETFQKTIKSEDFFETMDSIIQNVDVANDVLTDLTHFSKPAQYQMKKGSLARLLERALKLVQQQIKDKKILLVKEWSKDLPEILMDEKLLLHAYLNLLINSLESMGGGGRLTVKAFSKDNVLPPKIVVMIEDTGKGIPKELIPKLFQPFFSTKVSGVGLGLPIADGILRSHGGVVRFESEENKGTRVIVEFPPAS